MGDGILQHPCVHERIGKPYALFPVQGEIAGISAASVEYCQHEELEARHIGMPTKHTAEGKLGKKGKNFFIILYKLFVYMKNNVGRYIPIYLFVELFFIASNYIRAVFVEQIGQWQIAFLVSVCIEP